MNPAALLYLVKTNSGLWREVTEHEYDDSLGVKQVAVPVLPVSTEYDWALVRTDDGARLIDNPDKQAHLAQARRLAELEAAMAGVSQDALDGGWTALGLSNYAKSLEEKLAILQAATLAQPEPCDPSHLRIIADSGSVPGMQSALRMVADQLAATRDAPSADAIDAQRYQWLKAWNKLDGWTDGMIDRQIAIDAAIAASAPKGDGND